jgi:hypothetical protein
VFAVKDCGKKFNPNNSIIRHNKLVCGKAPHKKFFATSPYGARITIEEIILNLGGGGRRKGRGLFWPAPGRGQTSSSLSNRNIFGWFLINLLV